MACNELTSMSNDCNNNLGGIKSLYLSDVINLTGITIVENKITAISMVSPFKFVKYEFIKGSCSFDVDLDIDSNGISEYDHSMKFKISKRNPINLTKIIKITEGNRSLVALIQNKNNKWILVGYKYGMVTKSIKGGSGTSIGNGPTMDISMKGVQNNFEYEIDDSLIYSIIS